MGLPERNSEALAKEAECLYNAIAMYKVGNSFGDYLLTVWPKKLSIYDKLYKAVDRTRSFENFVDGIDSDGQLEWKKEWTERDYMIYGDVMCAMLNMSEEKRAAVGEFCKGLNEGNVIIEYDIPNSNE